MKNHLKGACLLLLFCATTNLLGVSPNILPATGNYLVSDTFNNAFSGDTPKDWATITTAGTVVVQEMPSAGNKSVRLLKTGTSNAVSASRSFTPTSGKVAVELKARAETTTPYEEFPTIFSSNGTIAVAVAFSGGHIISCAGSTWKTVQSFNAGEWYVVRVELDTVTDTYDLYIDGIRMLSGVAFKNPVTEVSKVTCAMDAGFAGTAYFDSVRVYSHAALIGSAPSPRFDITAYGAVGDGTTLNTLAIQNAINACSGTGGSVYVHDGVFKSGTLTLKSGMTLFIEPSATLLGSTNDADYPQQTLNTKNGSIPSHKAFIFASGASDLMIDGGGAIDGSGGFSGWHQNSGGTEALRPVLLYPVQCTNLVVQNVYLRNAAVWGFVPLECRYVTIRNIYEDTRDYGNRDGIDPVDCQHVLIENCTINSDDDCICPKSGSVAGVVDLTARYCNLLSTRANGIKFGTASYGQFKDSLFEDIMIKHCGCAGLAIESVDGASISNLAYRAIDMNLTAVPFYVIIGVRDNTPSGGTKRGAGSVDSILFQDIAATNQSSNLGSCLSGNRISGITYPLTNLTFRRCSVTFKGGVATLPNPPSEMGTQYPEYSSLGTMPAYGYFLRHAPNVILTDCTTAVSSTDVRPAQMFSDANVICYGNYQWSPPSGLTASVVNASTIQLSWQPASTPLRVWSQSLLDDASASISYSSAWSTSNDASAYLGAFHLSANTGDTATYLFNGTGIRLYSKLASNLGKATISIDGVTVATVDEYSSTNQFQQIIYQTASLTPGGSHTLTVKASGTKNASSSGAAITLDALETSSLPPTINYRLYRATVAGGPYTQIGTTASLSYLDSTVTEATPYYYLVTATAPGDESKPSGETSATAFTPARPTNLTGAVAYGKAALTWAPVTATSYNVKRSAIGGSNYTTIANVTIPSYLDPSLNSTQSYYYVVSGLLGSLEGPDSAPFTATDFYAQWVQENGKTLGAPGTAFTEKSPGAPLANGLLYGVPGGLFFTVTHSWTTTFNPTADIRNDPAMSTVLQNSTDLLTWTPVLWTVATNQIGVPTGFTRYTLQDILIPSQEKKFYRLLLTR